MSAAAATFVCDGAATPSSVAAPEGSTSNVMIGEPTSTVSPSP
jgi:hypothetical protein